MPNHIFFKVVKAKQNANETKPDNYLYESYRNLSTINSRRSIFLMLLSRLNIF